MPCKLNIFYSIPQFLNLNLFMQFKFSFKNRIFVFFVSLALILNMISFNVLSDSNKENLFAPAVILSQLARHFDYL